MRCALAPSLPHHPPSGHQVKRGRSGCQLSWLPQPRLGRLWLFGSFSLEGQTCRPTLLLLWEGSNLALGYQPLLLPLLRLQQTWKPLMWPEDPRLQGQQMAQGRQHLGPGGQPLRLMQPTRGSWRPEGGCEGLKLPLQQPQPMAPTQEILQGSLGPSLAS